MTKMYFHSLSLALLLVFSSATAAEDEPAFTKAGHTTDSLKKVKELTARKKAVLLDVREESEWNEGHLKFAKLLPLSVIREGTMTAKQKKLLPKDKPVYCHCRSGGRALIFAKLLRDKGYDIRPLKLGYVDLVKAGFVKAE